MLIARIIKKHKGANKEKFHCPDNNIIIIINYDNK